MTLTNYQIIYMLTSLFGVYTIYKFMRLFFDKRRTGEWVEFASYMLYNVLIAIIYFYIEIPLILLFVNIGSFIALSFNYEATLRHRILGSIYVFLILMIVEVIVGVASGFFGTSALEKSGFDNSALLILVRLLSYMLVLLLGRIKRARAGQDISSGSWLSVIGIPAASMYLVVVLFQAEGLQAANVVSSIAALLIINVLVFHLYDRLQIKAEEALERELLVQQNKYYDNQFQLMKTSEESLRAIRHDFKNHLSALSSLADKETGSEVRKYISELIDTSDNTERYINTGNVEIDSILNAKIQEAAAKGVTVNAIVAVPEHLTLMTFDLTVLLGNLIDNAIEGTLNARNGGSIDLDLRYSKNRLLLEISNPFTGEIELKDGLPVTKKRDKQNHGIGLKQVVKTLKKYDGDLDISVEEGRFKASAIIFLY